MLTQASGMAGWGWVMVPCPPSSCWSHTFPSQTSHQLHVWLECAGVAVICQPEMCLSRGKVSPALACALNRLHCRKIFLCQTLLYSIHVGWSGPGGAQCTSWPHRTENSTKCDVWCADKCSGNWLCQELESRCKCSHPGNTWTFITQSINVHLC